MCSAACAGRVPTYLRIGTLLRGTSMEFVLHEFGVEKKLQGEGCSTKVRRLVPSWVKMPPCLPPVNPHVCSMSLSLSLILSPWTIERSMRMELFREAR